MRLSSLFTSKMNLMNKIRTTLGRLTFLDVRTDRCPRTQQLVGKNPTRAGSLLQLSTKGKDAECKMEYSLWEISFLS